MSGTERQIAGTPRAHSFEERGLPRGRHREVAGGEHRQQVVEERLRERGSLQHPFVLALRWVPPILHHELYVRACSTKVPDGLCEQPRRAGRATAVADQREHGTFRVQSKPLSRPPRRCGCERLRPQRCPRHPQALAHEGREPPQVRFPREAGAVHHVRERVVRASQRVVRYRHRGKPPGRSREHGCEGTPPAGADHQVRAEPVEQRPRLPEPPERAGGERTRVAHQVARPPNSRFSPMPVPTGSTTKPRCSIHGRKRASCGSTTREFT